MTVRIAAPFGALLCVVAILAAAGGSVQAADCNGLDKTACERRAECTYVDSYTRKDGTKVSAHCRSKPKSSQSLRPKDKTSS